MRGVGVMYGESGEEFVVLYRIWQSKAFIGDSWGGTFAVLTPSPLPPAEGSYTLFLEDRHPCEIAVWQITDGAVGEFIGLDSEPPNGPETRLPRGGIDVRHA